MKGPCRLSNRSAPSHRRLTSPSPTTAPPAKSASTSSPTAPAFPPSTFPLCPVCLFLPSRSPSARARQDAAPPEVARDILERHRVASGDAASQPRRMDVRLRKTLPFSLVFRFPGAPRAERPRSKPPPGWMAHLEKVVPSCPSCLFHFCRRVGGPPAFPATSRRRGGSSRFFTQRTQRESTQRTQRLSTPPCLCVLCVNPFLFFVLDRWLERLARRARPTPTILVVLF